MADNGRRDVVRDPLADVGSQVQDRSLAVGGVFSPSNGSPANNGPAAALASAISGLETVVGQAGEISKDKFITQGKMDYMAGKTEHDLINGGNRYTQQGYKQLQTQDGANRWFMDQKSMISTDYTQMDPKEYQQHLNTQRAEFLKGVTDPDAQKIAVAAFEQYSPDLVSSQFAANNEFNRGQKINSFGQLITSGAQTSSSVSRPGDGPLKLSDTPTSSVLTPSTHDRDIGIRTMIGEAASQGSEGLAAVAHVMRNRATDGRWPDSISGVALQNKQFSTWNAGAGGNSLHSKYAPGNPVYERAGKVFDAVMSGRHVDATNGATHYYSPAGMTALVNEGSQGNVVPKWLQAEARRSNGTIRIGGHVFVGRASGAQVSRASVDTSGGVMYTGQVNGDGTISTATQDTSVTGVSPASAVNDTQDLIRGYTGLSSADKATALAAQMQAQLQSGDDTLYRDGGGVGMLYELNATPDQIAQVKSAADTYAAKQLDAFDIEDEKWRGEIIADAESGKDIDGILSKIDERRKSNQLSDNEAQSLARASIAQVKAAQGAAADKSKTSGNVPYMAEIGGLYQQIDAGGLDFEAAAAEAKRVGEKYGAKPDEVSTVIGQMFSMDQSKQNALRRSVEEGKQKYADAQQAKSEIGGMIARGYGLHTATGDIPTVNTAGVKTSVSKQQYGIQSIKDATTNAWKAKLDAGVVNANEAKTGIIVDTFKSLQQQQVVDTETQSQIVGALSGSITDKDGNLTDSSQKAYDLWQILRNNPDVQPGYLAQTVGNAEVRALLETAHVLEGGNMTGSEALRRAHELLADPQRDPNERITKDAIWQARLEKGATDFLGGKTGLSMSDRFWGKGMQGFKQNAQGAATATMALAGKQRAMTFVQNRAEAYHMNNPNLDAEVSMKMGLADLDNSVSVVEGNVLISPQKSLASVMGVEQFGADAAPDAISNYLKDYGQDIWGDAYSASKLSSSSSGTPQYNITVNHASGVLTVDIYKDITKGIMLGKPQHFDLKAIGTEYYNKKTKLTTWDDMWNSAFKLPTAVAKEVEAGNRRMDNPGAIIGGMVSPVK